MANQPHVSVQTIPDVWSAEIEEVDISVGFIVGCCCSSLELEEDEDECSEPGTTAERTAMPPSDAAAP